MLCQVRAVSHSCLYKRVNSLLHQPGQQSSHPQTEIAQQVLVFSSSDAGKTDPSFTFWSALSVLLQPGDQQRHRGRELGMHLQLGMSKDVLAGNGCVHTNPCGSTFPFANQKKVGRGGQELQVPAGHVLHEGLGEQRGGIPPG